MSYEGREFLLCEDGHIHAVDTELLLYREWDDVGMCSAKVPDGTCNKPWQWRFSVNDTNGEGQEPDPAVISEAEICKCSGCGQMHYKSDTRYEPSLKDGWVEIRPPQPRRRIA